MTSVDKTLFRLRTADYRGIDKKPILTELRSARIELNKALRDLPSGSRNGGRRLAMEMALLQIRNALKEHTS